MRRFFLISIISILTLCCANAQTRQPQEWRDSIAKLSAMIERYPQNIELRLRKAAVNIELEQWKYALEEYTKVLELEPKNIAALYYRAFVNHHLGRYNYARMDYEAVLDQTPIDKHALMGLTLTNLADNHKTEAFDSSNRLTTMFPNDADVYEIRSEVEEHLGMYEAAIDDINKAIELETAKMEEQNITTITINDDMVSYQLTAFLLQIKKGNRMKAQAHLEYLTSHGISRALLDNYFKQLKGIPPTPKNYISFNTKKKKKKE